MALKTFVKISNVTNLTEARYCAGMYVDLMGFTLEPGDEHFLNPQAFREITDWLSGLHYVGEFSTSNPEAILEQVRAYDSIEYIQVEEEYHLHELARTSSYKLILKKRVHTNEQLRELLPLADFLKKSDILLLIDTDNPDRFPYIDWQTIHALAQSCDILLGFGFTVDTVEQVLKDTEVKGIVISGGKEIKPGVSDFDELAELLERLETDD